MKDMAIVFREFDEDADGKIPVTVAHHIMTLFRLNSKECFKDEETIHMLRFLDEAGVLREEIFGNPSRRYLYYFQMIAGLGQKTMNAVDIHRFIKTCGDEIDRKFCEDFIDEFDRKKLSKQSLTAAEFCVFCANKKIPA